VALVGANGSGKTTLARHLNALLVPTSGTGTVHIAGFDTRQKSDYSTIRTFVGMVFQSPERPDRGDDGRRRRRLWPGKP